jgi:hypothetical protein
LESVNTPAPPSLADAARPLGIFIRALYEPDDWVELRPLPSADERSWHRAKDVQQILRECVRLNRRRQNVYVGINPRKGAGQAGAAGVLLSRCFFVDFDENHLTATALPEQTAEVLVRIATAGLPAPSILVCSGHGVHAYWLLTAPVTDLDAWEVAIDALVGTLGSCQGAKGRERIMRVPPFLNWKAPIALAALVECHADRRYEWSSIADVVLKSNPPPPPIAGSIEQAVARHAGRPQRADRSSVIQAFNDRVPVAEVLRAGGYDVVGKHFRRPGKVDRGWSGIIREDRHGRLVSAHWSSNDPMNDHRFGGGTCSVHDAFDAFATLEHGGNVSAAVKAAAALLAMPLPPHKTDTAILEEITASDLADAFATHFFADPQTPASRSGMRDILDRFTTNPRQVDRILAMPKKKSVTA